MEEWERVGDRREEDLHPEEVGADGCVSCCFTDHIYLVFILKKRKETALD